MSRSHVLPLYFVLCSGALIAASPAQAHAKLVSAEPAPDSMAMPAPKELRLGFSEGLELKFSGVKLVGPDKAPVATGAARLDPRNDKELAVPITATLPDGTYTVEWRALSKDGHKTEGHYSFESMQ